MTGNLKEFSPLTMKTNTTILSEKDRSIYGVVIRQESKTGFMNLSDLQEAYTNASVLNNWNNISVHRVLKSQTNIDRIYFLYQEIFKSKIYYDDFIKKYGIVKILKHYKLYKVVGARLTKTIYCEKKLFCLIMQGLNPIFFLDSLKILSNNNKDLIHFTIKQIEETENKIFDNCPDIKNVCTYFILDTLSNEIKIGYAKDLRKRYVTHKISNTHIRYLGHVNNNIETELHRVFKDFNTSGEWFNIKMSDIETYLKKTGYELKQEREILQVKKNLKNSICLKAISHFV